MSFTLKPFFYSKATDLIAHFVSGVIVGTVQIFDLLMTLVFLQDVHKTDHPH